jgi:zinc protease
MRFQKIALLSILFVALSSCKRDKGNESSNAAPYAVKEYTLKNGLKVFLSVNKDAPRIQTAITVKAGSKYDPAATTGLAHYLEHMLFKGSSKFGTIDYAKERPFLDSIEALYEIHKNTVDPYLKKEIYARIDSFSYEASKLAIPNEYDKMVSSIGAKGTNAFTSNDLTCYINDIPSSALEKWLFLESNRFQTLVLRIFHTELEAVYEEFNISTAYDQEWSSQAVDSMLMPNHPYGTQTTIGLSEHLKNPSLLNIKKYFDTYYVPNNCAIVMSGDLDPDKTIAMIEKYFGDWKSKEVPVFEKATPVEIKTPLFAEKTGQEPAHVYVGFRFDGANTTDPMMVTLVDALLSNGKGSGIFDLNLKLNQKILDGYSTFSNNKDYTIHKLYGMPKEGQSLEQVKNLLLSQIDSIKQGNFPDWMLSAVIDNMRLDKLRAAETNSGRVFDVVFAFVKDIPLKAHLAELEAMSKVTKADIVKFANERYGENYAVCYKRFGEPSLYKVDKPKITPVFVNKEAVSDFHKQFDAIKEGAPEARFCDFKTSIQEAKTSTGLTLYYQPNEINQTFKLDYIFDMGTDNNKLLGLALDFLPYMGTDKYTAAQVKQEFYKLGLEFSVNSSRDQVFVSLSGLEKNLAKGVELFEYLLKNVKADKDVYTTFAQDIIKKRADAKLDKDQILWGGLLNYGKYGKLNPFNNVLSNEIIESLDANELAATIHGLCSYKHSVYYYGAQPLDDANTVISRLHNVQAPLKAYPTAVKYEEQSTELPTVYFADYNMKQAQIIFLSKGHVFDKSEMPALSLFNEYYGGSMASVVFQEIREKMALAYSASGRYAIQRIRENRILCLHMWAPKPINCQPLRLK